MIDYDGKSPSSPPIVTLIKLSYTDTKNSTTLKNTQKKKRKQKKIHCRYNNNCSTNIDKGDMDAIKLSFSDEGMSYTMDECDNIFFELSEMSANGRKYDSILFFKMC